VLTAAVLFPASAPGAKEDICELIQEAIAGGKSAEVVVRSALELGHQTCLVVGCAIKGGGTPSEVFNGAMAVGTGTAVFTRCAIDAGLDPGHAAALIMNADLSMNLCYFGNAAEQGSASLMESLFTPEPEFASTDETSGGKAVSPEVPAGL
jgi:hypothetical protein